MAIATKHLQAGLIKAQHLDAQDINASGVLTASSATFTGTMPLSQLGTGTLNSGTYINGTGVISPKVQTSNYAEDGSGFATAGAKLDSQGTAIKCAPGGLQIGSYTFGTMAKYLGSAYLNGQMTAVDVTISPAQPDTGYMVIATPIGVNAQPNVEAFTIYKVTKYTDHVHFQIRGPAGGTDSGITWEFVLLRLPT